MKIEKFLSNLLDPLDELKDDRNRLIMFLQSLKHWQGVGFSQCRNCLNDDIYSYKIVPTAKCDNCGGFLSSLKPWQERHFFARVIDEFLTRFKPYVPDKELFKKVAFALLDHPHFWDDEKNWRPHIPSLLNTQFKYLFLSEKEYLETKDWFSSYSPSNSIL